MSSTQLHKISPKWQEPHLCTEASEMVIELVSSHTTGVTLPVWLKVLLSLLARDLMMNRHEREEKFLSFVALDSDFGRESSHLYEREREKVCFLGFSPLPCSLGKDAMEINGILLGNKLISGVFGS